MSNMRISNNFVSADSPVESTEVQDFHNNRLLFLIVGNTIFFERSPSGLSHIDWIKDLNFNDVIIPYNQINPSKDYHYIMTNFVRGYYYNDSVVLYAGYDFYVDNKVVDTVRYCLDLIIDAFNLSDNSKVGLGCIPVKNRIFEVKYPLGTIDFVRKLGDFKDIYLRLKSDKEGIGNLKDV